MVAQTETMAPSTSTGQEVNLMHCFVGSLVSSCQLTIGEKNSKVERVSLLLMAVCMAIIFIVASAGLAYDMSREAIWGAGTRWWQLVVMLSGFYLALVQLAMGHLTLFLPQAPFAAWEALHNVGFKGIGFAVALTSGAVVLFDQAWVFITWAFLLGILIAGILAFWVWLVRKYGR